MADFEVTSDVMELQFEYEDEEYNLNGRTIRWNIKNDERHLCFNQEQADHFIEWLDQLDFLQNNDASRCTMKDPFFFYTETNRPHIVRILIKIHPDRDLPFSDDWIPLGFEVEGTIQYN